MIDLKQARKISFGRRKNGSNKQKVASHHHTWTKRMDSKLATQILKAETKNGISSYIKGARGGCKTISRQSQMERRAGVPLLLHLESYRDHLANLFCTLKISNETKQIRRNHLKLRRQNGKEKPSRNDSKGLATIEIRNRTRVEMFDPQLIMMMNGAERAECAEGVNVFSLALNFDDTDRLF